MTDNENALIAYAILDEVNGSIGNVAHDVLMRDIARAQVYATLATMPSPPSQDAIVDALDAALSNAGYPVLSDGLTAAAEAVGRLL